MAKRTTKVTVETHSLTILRTRGSASVVWCAACGMETQTVTVELAASLCSVTQRTIFRMLEADHLHFNETATGQLLICLESLRQLAESSARERDFEL